MKLTEYEGVKKLLASNIFIIDGPDGTKNIRADDAAKELLKLAPTGDLVTILEGQLSPEMHRNIFRGNNLGSSVTVNQLASIRDGSFKDLYVGDYWVINGVTWRIADIDYWLRCGDQELTKHHLVIVPDTALYSAKMNSTNTTVGGYVGSEMYTTNLQQAKTMVTSAFGSAVLSHREYLTNAVTTGYPSAGSWYDSTVELMNECMVYGAHVFTPAGDGSMIPARYTISKTQLALFRLAPKFITIWNWYWLRDVVSSSYFALVYSNGRASYGRASDSGGVRVAFGIC